MKSKLLCTVTVLLLSLCTRAQEKPAWGSDVNVMPVAGMYYKDVRVATAYDGSIYLGRLVASSPGGPYQTWEVLKSTDNGATWAMFNTSFLSGSQKYTALDMITAGENATDFRLYLARPYQDTVSKDAVMRVSNYDASGSATNIVLSNATFTSYTGQRGFNYISFATDSRKPATNSSPYDICLVASKAGPQDSLVVWASDDGGDNFVYRSIQNSSSYIMRVSACMGVCEAISSYPRLGIAYEEFANSNDSTGKLWARFIYGDDATDITNTGPYQVGTSGAQYAVPSIAMSQTSGSGTGPGFEDFRTIIGYQFYNSVADGMDVSFRYSDNLYYAAPDFSSTGGVVIGAGSGNQLNPHVIFDPGFVNFLLTYYDEGTGKLPYCIKNMSGSSSAPFTVFYANYRNATSKPYPYLEPRLDINMATMKGVFAWKDNYNSMFDAENSTLSITNASPLNATQISLYPNPARDHVKLSLNVTESDQAMIQVTDVTGKPVLQQEVRLQAGANEYQVNVAALAAGNYILQLKGTHTQAVAQLAILR